MTINLSVPEQTKLQPRITVFGVGGAGGNGVNNMIESGLQGADFVVANTDAQALSQSLADRRIQMGTAITQGLGAGSRPQVGEAAAEEALEEIIQHLTGCHMAFITAGMGGGTGTGAAPVIARAAREMGILTVGVVTKPFQFEGARRMRIADEGIDELQRYVDTLIIIPNQNLFRVANEKTTFTEAFGMADQVLRSGVAGITDLMVCPGVVNLDFADVRTVMNEMGKAMMGTGEASGEARAVAAAEAAIANPLLDEVSMKGARGVLINVSGDKDMGLFEVDEAANRIRKEVDPDANIIFGSTCDPSLEGIIRVSVVATGIDTDAAVDEPPVAQPAAEPVRGFRLRSQPEAATGTAAAPAAAAKPTAPAAPLPPLGRDIDPADYEAEVIIHKPKAPADTAGAAASAPAAAQTAAVTRDNRAAYMPQGGARPVPKPRKKAPGFFERITGAALGNHDEAGPAPALPRGAGGQGRGAADPRAGRIEPRVSTHAGLRPQPDASPQAVPGQPAKAGRELAPEPVEEEQFDIPTFLRRQAN